MARDTEGKPGVYVPEATEENSSARSEDKGWLGSQEVKRDNRALSTESGNKAGPGIS